MTRWKTAWQALTCVGLALISGVTTAGCRGGRFGNILSKSDEIQMGQDYSRQLERDPKIHLITAGPQYDRLERVAARIMPLAKADYDVPYSVKLIDSKEVNAFALPGGPIYFYKGLMDLTDTDDQVASVLGHEATHVVRRHAAKQISDAQLKGTIAQLALGRAPGLAQTGAGLFLQIQQLSYSRDDEAQADEGGFRYLTEANYDPDSMAQMFRKLQSKESDGGGPVWLQNHPLTKSRIQVAEQRATEYKREHNLSQ